jgi:DNA-binding LacI/PurR family transcriptional regulator
LSLRTKGPTLKDIARRSGVSTATVARVLHKSGYVAEETRQTVEQVVAETGYQINAVAQGLRKQRTFTLGHIVQAIAPNPFFAGVALGVEQEATEHGCGVVIVTTQGDPERERAGVQTLIRRRVDAIIFTKIAHEANVAMAVHAGIPVVQVERVSAAPAGSVTADNYPGSLAATRHLIDLGHRRIAFLGVSPSPPLPMEPDRRPTTAADRKSLEGERLAGFLDAMAAANELVCEELIDLGGTYYAQDWARASTYRLLKLPSDRRPTAIFASCDMLAAGALQAIHACRLRVPDDVSVVGFDDTYASHLTPALTTARQPMREMGRAAARLAIESLQRSNPMTERSSSVRLRTDLIIRESTGAAPLES